MRKLILILLMAVLTAIVAARAMLPEPSLSAMAEEDGCGYNVLDLDLPLARETAGSALIAEMNAYYFFRAPTAKSALTGALRGKNLILICADNWCPDAAGPRAGPLRRMQSGVRFSEVYRPDWYQGMDGREFALLSGLMPTSIDGETSLVWTGRQDVYLPYALPRAFSSEGYACYAFTREESHRDAYTALGFPFVEESGAPALDTLEATMDAYISEGPFFVYYVWPDANAENALEYLLSRLDDERLSDDTAVCLLTGSGEAQRANLFLRAAGLSADADAPCSELDVTPTLLNLFGVEFDSRFLSGRDVFAPAGDPRTVSAATAVVSLYGSAYSDWVTDAGRYAAAERLFYRTSADLSGGSAVTAYVHDVSALVYDRYIFARKAMESNYFQLVLGT